MKTKTPSKQGHSHDFSEGVGGKEVTLCRGDGTHQMVMSFSPSVLVVCLKIAYKGRGRRDRHPRNSPMILR